MMLQDFIREAEEHYLHYLESLRSIEGKFMGLVTDETPLSEGLRLIGLAEVHLKMRRIALAEKELVNALVGLFEYDLDILHRGNAISEVIPRVLFMQEHRPLRISIIQARIKAAEMLSGIYRCANRKYLFKRFDRLFFKSQEELRKELALMQEPQLVQMRVVDSDFTGIYVSPIS